MFLLCFQAKRQNAGFEMIRCSPRGFHDEFFSVLGLFSSLSIPPLIFLTMAEVKKTKSPKEFASQFCSRCYV